MGQIEHVRRFNRLVTQRVGALNDHYLARDRPLGEARLLYEIGPDGADVRTLRVRLDLDSGYLSRLLRSLQAAGLVTVEASETDRRVRVAKRTAAGNAEAAVLDERSNALAASFLEPLNAGQRDRLVKAMGEVGRLLTAGLVTITQVDPDHRDAVYCRTAYFAELDRRFPDGHDPARGIPVDGDALRLPAGLMLVAYLHGDPVGSGALRFLPGEPAHLKRMWVTDSARGLGIGRRLLAELEARAAAQGCDTVHLETHSALAEAIGMYRAAGYVEVEPFNDEYFAHHWFEKKL
jgi:DNA-binding MarR family transcriptional regulator/GNAT superfamily N-acetyltransferase